jgi:hypothetical protein
MPLTLLQIVQDAATLVGLDKPSSVVGSTHPTATKALAMLHVEGAELRRNYAWDALKRTHTVTLVNGTQAYALPADFERHVPSTHWDNGMSLPATVVGSQDWQFVQHANFVYTSSKVMRFWTWLNNQIYLYSTPDSTDAGNTITFEYQSATWIRYRTWLASTGYATGNRVWYNGNRYTWVSGTTSGSTAPTHTVGNASDGGVTWAYNSTELQERFEYDTDIPLIDGVVLQLSLQAALYEDLGQSEQAQAQRARAAQLATQVCTNLKGPSAIALTDMGVSEGAFMSNNSVRIV